ncbi:adenylosuccinate synthase [Helicobacter heilmannii]|uniref:Adenylosuccinate synthetase n=1 Tax=Helicobacter heilmannii TaxID=35817 RepID=A0A0K2Y8D2_HELHE|nr:adenylosuccinate synthase [Helicobacter heilmannii]BDQ28026.1 adenylosuccinate synthetase [Helicobacter heilmannii]CCM10835.1 Adenylosuccinate synthetase [Helicobacter heilmannii ASB1.4]CRI35128.1 Adenylosuccinate synthetase [Helicobacter heilmannii]
MADVVVGVQWGDEGKGKLVDRLAPNYDFVVRFQGGHNAGHTIVADGKTHALHLIPSGVLYPQCKNVIGNGVVVALDALLKEMKPFGDLKGRLFVSDRAHLILPHHPMQDMRTENGRGAIGTTKKGIGPAYQDKIGRVGLRVGDLREPKLLKDKLAHHLSAHAHTPDLPTLKALEDYLNTYAPKVLPYTTDTTALLWEAIDQNKKILLEGAQGSMLDVDFGTYPFVTSSTTIAAGACSGSGLSVKDIDKIIGVAKAYCTRVGLGPFPTEDLGQVGAYLREKGHEYGTTTNRARRCGYFDAVAVKYACRLNGCSELALMKLDVLDGLEEILVGVGYENSSPSLEGAKPIYKCFKGWGHSAGVGEFNALPKEAQEYILALQELIGVKIGAVSTSPQRENMVLLP